jgi:hypothetical protein
MLEILIVVYLKALSRVLNISFAVATIWAVA